MFWVNNRSFDLTEEEQKKSKMKRWRSCRTEENTSEPSRARARVRWRHMPSTESTTQKFRPFFFFLLLLSVLSYLPFSGRLSTQKKENSEEKRNQSFSSLQQQAESRGKKGVAEKHRNKIYVVLYIEGIECQANRYILECMRPRAVASVYCV